MLRGSPGFQKATSEPAGKAKKLTAWHLMPHKKKHPGKQGCSCQFRNYKIFTSPKNRSVNIYPLVLFLFSCISFLLLFVASLTSVIYQLLLIILPVVLYLHSFILLIIPNSLLFCSIYFVQLFIVWLFSVIFSVLVVFQVFQSPYQQPYGKSKNIIPQDCAIFCVSKGRESLLPS